MIFKQFTQRVDLTGRERVVSVRVLAVQSLAQVHQAHLREPAVQAMNLVEVALGPDLGDRVDRKVLQVFCQLGCCS